MANFGFSTSNDWSQNVVEFRKSNWNSSSEPVPMQLNYHSGIGNYTVEGANRRNPSQIAAIDDQTAQIRTVQHKSKDEYLREERFLGVPISSKSSFSGQFGSMSTFIVEVKKYLKLEPDSLPSKNPAIIPILVDKIVQGILEEGKQIGKEQKAEKIASALRKKKDAGIEEVWKQSVYIYTSKNFLSKSLNSTLKLVVDKEKEKIWKSKVPTLGPFCLLLLDYPFNKDMAKNKTIYRSANMEAAQIALYEEMAKDKNLYQSFQVYTSCTRNRKKAKALGNTLFVMDVLNGFIMDLSSYSKYPYEEEELITPGVCFRVKSVTFDQKKNRNMIHLELRQKVPSKYRVRLFSY